MEFLRRRELELANGPFDDLIIPLKGGAALRVPIVFLEPEYSFVFDRAKDTWICSVHGNDGWFDEENPIECEPGDNPDVEW